MFKIMPFWATNDFNEVTNMRSEKFILNIALKNTYLSFSAYNGIEYDGEIGDLFDGTEESPCTTPCLQTKV